MGFPGSASAVGGHNGFNAAAAAAAHYAAIQRNERERERLRDLDDISYRTPSSQGLDPDDRSRSPQPLFLNRDNRDLNGPHGMTNPGNSTGGGGGGGGGDSSVSGDQASTIDDSDSDCGKCLICKILHYLGYEFLDIFVIINLRLFTLRSSIHLRDGYLLDVFLIIN